MHLDVVAGKLARPVGELVSILARGREDRLLHLLLLGKGQGGRAAGVFFSKEAVQAPVVEGINSAADGVSINAAQLGNALGVSQLAYEDDRVQAGHELPVSFLLEQPSKRGVVRVRAGHGHGWGATHILREDQKRYTVNGFFVASIGV